jgi:hypothetical protein
MTKATKMLGLHAFKFDCDKLASLHHPTHKRRSETNIVADFAPLHKELSKAMSVDKLAIHNKVSEALS